MKNILKDSSSYIKQKISKGILSGNQGGILLSVLSLVSLFNLLLLFTLESYAEKAVFASRTQRYYLAKTLENMSIKQIKDSENAATIQFNQGKVKYIRTNNRIKLETELTTGEIYHSEFTESQDLSN